MTFHANSADSGKRLDLFLQEKLPDFSRSRIQTWIKEMLAQVNGEPGRPSQTLRPGDMVTFQLGDVPSLHAVPEEIELSILYEDEHLIAIDKAAGMVVHAGAGVHTGTLVNALLHRFQNLSTVGGELRPGIVHRLDRFTSGVILAAKSDLAHQRLAAQFAARKVRKLYLTMVHGIPAARAMRIEKPIARDPIHRVRMTARLASGRAAVSEYTVLEKFPSCTFLQVLIGTGRTHQIRVHLASIGHPVVGDRLYGAPAAVPGQPPLDRYFLHAHRIEIAHPITGEPLQIESPLSPDLAKWKATLK